MVRAWPVPSRQAPISSTSARGLSPPRKASPILPTSRWWCDARAADLVVSAAITGTPASWLKASLASAGYDPDDLGKPATRDYGGDPAKKWRDLWAAGQGLHAVSEIASLARIVDELKTGVDSRVPPPRSIWRQE